MFLLRSEKLETTNHSTILKLFDKDMGILWPTGVQHNNVLLILSNAAPYMIKVEITIQTLYSKVIHVTCSAPVLHRLTKILRGEFSEVGKVVSSVKQVFRKALIHTRSFKNMTNDKISSTPEPILTRWSTWINATHYIIENTHCGILISWVDFYRI